MNRTRLFTLIGVGFALFLGFITWQMTSLRQNRVEVCMAFEGRQQCSTASGASKQEAARTATDAACALISSGVTGTQACARTQPLSVRWLD
ncbi:MAG TPA: hypothetical protein PKJ41_12985 [Bryobacteraceae bacterium]|nr:hypothetical protein [Bryobacteraceae bacterium]